MTGTVVFAPDWASPPGDTLLDLLGERDMTQTDLAERLGVTLKHVNRVIKGAASISPELALGLEKVFGLSADFWMTREGHYRADVARLAERETLREAVGWARTFPIKELRDRELIPRHGQDVELVEHLLRFFGIASPSQWREPAVAYRRSQKFTSDEQALAAWLREAEVRSMSINTEPYSEARFLDVLQEARGLTREDPEVWYPLLQTKCAAAGVAVVVIDTFNGVRANGAARWLAPDRALIQLSLRYTWADIFWFSFFHEAAHIVLHRKKDIFVEVARKDAKPDPERQQLEAEADKFAARTLIPKVHEHRLRTLNPPEIPAFAKTIGVSPGIVAGRLKHDGLLAWSKGNDLRTQLTFAEPG